MTKASGELFQHLLLLLECSLFCSCLPTQHTQHMISTSKLANVGLVSFGLAGVVSLHFRDGNGKPIQKSRSNILEWTQGTNVEQAHQFDVLKAEPIPKQRFLLTPSLSLSRLFFSRKDSLAFLMSSIPAPCKPHLLRCNEARLHDTVSK